MQMKIPVHNGQGFFRSGERHTETKVRNKLLFGVCQKLTAVISHNQHPAA